MRTLVYLLLCGFLWASCGQGVSEESSTIEVSTEDAVVQRILDFANKRETQSLLPFLVVDNTMHRYVAALALASVQDSAAIPDLGNALYDKNEQVRWAAAFALGQSQKVAAAKYLIEAFQTDTVRRVQAAILEAIGRCGDTTHLKYLSTTPPYPSKDTLLLEGQVLGLYRFATRGMVYEEGVRKVVIEFIANPVLPESARMIAAAFLARARDINLTPYEQVLLENLEKEENPYIRQFLAMAVGKLKTKKAMLTLRRTYREEPDYRVRCQILRSFSNFTYDSVRTVAFEALNDTSLQVQEAAADYLRNSGLDRDAVLYSNLGDAHPHWLIAVKLQEAAMATMAYYKTPSKQFISQKLRARYQTTGNLYERAAILRAMGSYSGNYRFIADQIFPRVDSIQVPFVLRSSGAEALVAIRQKTDLAREWGLGYARVVDELNALLVRMIGSNDAAMVAIAAQSITDHADLYRNAFPDVLFLTEARRRLQLPRDIETDIFLQSAIAALTGTPQPVPRPDKKNFVEIDWQALNLLKTNPYVLLQTNKGAITFQLFPEYCPATVTQFVQLVKADYYTNKPFHRVVPNFVVQGGCARGDGWGGFGVIAPSEFTQLRFDAEGWVGMASAGKDTESTQFFITHSPTPHLDGRYTIFAKVVKGMEVVHQIAVGDTLLSAKLR